MCGRQLAARLEDEKVPSLSPDQNNLMNTDVIRMTSTARPMFDIKMIPYTALTIWRICDSTANQFAVSVSAQSSYSLPGVSVESQSMANPLRMRCELISTNVEKKYSFA